MNTLIVILSSLMLITYNSESCIVLSNIHPPNQSNYFETTSPSWQEINSTAIEELRREYNSDEIVRLTITASEDGRSGEASNLSQYDDLKVTPDKAFELVFSNLLYHTPNPTISLMGTNIINDTEYYSFHQYDKDYSSKVAEYCVNAQTGEVYEFEFGHSIYNTLLLLDSTMGEKNTLSSNAKGEIIVNSVEFLENLDGYKTVLSKEDGESLVTGYSLIEEDSKSISPDNWYALINGKPYYIYEESIGANIRRAARYYIDVETAEVYYYAFNHSKADSLIFLSGEGE